MSTNQSSWPNSGQILQLYVWKFCRWGADVPPGETSLAVRNSEKQLYSQAIIALPRLKTNRKNSCPTSRTKVAISRLYINYEPSQVSFFPPPREGREKGTYRLNSSYVFCNQQDF